MGPEAAVDGRRLRAERNRDAVVDAMLALLREGELRPGARRIADRAGVGLRTVFRHFEDLDVLYAAAVERQSRHIQPLLADPPTDGSLGKRVHALVAQRARLFEEIAPVRRAALLQAPFHEPLRRHLREVNRRLRRQVGAVFAAEVEAADEPALVLDALDAATSWQAWEAFRSDQSMSAARAAAAMTRTVRGLLAPVPTDDPKES